MTVKPTARFTINQMARRRGWTVGTDEHGGNSDKFTRDGDSIVVYYDTVYQSVLHAGQTYGDQLEINQRHRRKKERVLSWLCEPRKQAEYPDRPPTAPDSVPNAAVTSETTYTSWGVPVEPETKPKTTWNVVLFGPNRFSHVTVEADDFSIDNVNGVKALIFGGLINPTHFYNMAYVVSWEKA